MSSAWQLIRRLCLYWPSRRPRCPQCPIDYDNKSPSPRRDLVPQTRASPEVAVAERNAKDEWEKKGARDLVGSSLQKLQISLAYGRPRGVGRVRGVGVTLGVAVALGDAVAVAVGVAVAVAVGVGVGVPAGNWNAPIRVFQLKLLVVP